MGKTVAVARSIGEALLLEGVIPHGVREPHKYLVRTALSVFHTLFLIIRERRAQVHDVLVSADDKHLYIAQAQVLPLKSPTVEGLAMNL